MLVSSGQAADWEYIDKLFQVVRTLYEHFITISEKFLILCLISPNTVYFTESAYQVFLIKKALFRDLNVRTDFLQGFYTLSITKAENLKSWESGLRIFGRNSFAKLPIQTLL